MIGGALEPDGLSVRILAAAPSRNGDQEPRTETPLPLLGSFERVKASAVPECHVRIRGR